MTLDELRQLIIESDREHDWHRLPAGPYFTDAPDIDEDTFRQHDELLVYRHDLDLTVQWGLEWGDGERKQVSDYWHDVTFPDMSVKVCFADVFWRRSLVDRVEILAVDGHRAYLPLGTQQAIGYDSSKPPHQQENVTWEYSATAFEVGLARVINGNRDFDRYFNQSGLLVKD